MKKNLFWGLSLLFLFSACQQTALQTELESTKAALTEVSIQLAAAQETLAELQVAPTNGQLVHVVYFKLKPDADIPTMILELKKLEAIEAVKDLKVGTFQDLADPRALSDYALVMELTFANEADYQTYQQHPLHEASKENTKEFLAGPPSSYDYVVK